MRGDVLLLCTYVKVKKWFWWNITKVKDKNRDYICLLNINRLNHYHAAQGIRMLFTQKKLVLLRTVHWKVLWGAQMVIYDIAANIFIWMSVWRKHESAILKVQCSFVFGYVNPLAEEFWQAEWMPHMNTFTDCAWQAWSASMLQSANQEVKNWCSQPIKLQVWVISSKQIKTCSGLEGKRKKKWRSKEGLCG